MMRRGLLAALAATIGCLALGGPGASAAAPANDDFADREVLSGPLPIEVERSNIEATKEGGEFIPGLAPAGHSVWFEWEADGTDWVTIGACDDEFPTILGVFTGSELTALTPAASGNADEGPDCPYSQRQYTFKALDGTKYVIAVDGNVFHLPDAPLPVTEGEIVLRIEATPPPPNDDFADAGDLVGRIDEEPGGNRFYFAHTQGYNWEATTEPGEPIDETPSGASVWYSWTAPESGKYLFGGPCCGLGLNWGLYGGDSVDDLTPYLAATGGAEFNATAGTTYRILVYGTPDLGTGEPTMASFGFFISASLPPLPPPPAGGSQERTPASDLTPPETTLLPVGHYRQRTLGLRTKFFVFRSSESPSAFRCRLDGRPFVDCGVHHPLPCATPVTPSAACSAKTYRNLKPGRHKFEVFAIDAAGNADPNPAKAQFKVPKPKPQKSRG